MNADSVLQYIAQRQQSKEAAKRNFVHQLKVPMPPTRLPRQGSGYPDEHQGHKGNSDSASEQPHAQSEGHHSNLLSSRHRDAFDTDAEDLDDTTIISNGPSIADPEPQRQKAETQSCTANTSQHPNQDLRLSGTMDVKYSDECEASYDDSGEDDEYEAASQDVLAAKYIAENRPVPQERIPSSGTYRLLSLSSTIGLAQRENTEACRSIAHPQVFLQDGAAFLDERRMNVVNRKCPMYHREKTKHFSLSKPRDLETGESWSHQESLDHGDCYGARPTSRLANAAATNRCPNAENGPEPSEGQRLSNIPITSLPNGKPRKRTRELDYSTDQLAHMAYQQLKDESFDCIPLAHRNQSTATISSSSLKDELNQMFSNHQDDGREECRKLFFASLAIDQYEVCGDLIIDNFSAIMSRVKKVRQQKRTAARLFEAEIELRHDLVSRKRTKIEQELQSMQQKGKDIVPKRSRA